MEEKEPLPIRILIFFRKNLWWRFSYKKTTVSPRVVSKGRCRLCDGRLQCSHPRRPCPCDINEILIKL